MKSRTISRFVRAAAAVSLCLCMVPAVPSMAAGETGSVKDVYIDNTVDNSMSYVTGTIHITGSGGEQAGYQDGTTVYNSEFQVTYSNPKTEQVQGGIDAAYTQMYTTVDDLKARAKDGEIHMSTSESIGKVWDNRKYTTVEDGDAVLIGDSDYLTGAYGANDQYTRTHIASGDYGKETFYIVEASGWLKGFSITVSVDGDGDASSDLTESLSQETVSVSASAKDGFQFKNWEVVSGGASLSDTSAASTTFTMPKADVELKAVFEKTGGEEPEDPDEPQDPDEPKDPDQPQGGGSALAVPVHEHTYEWYVIKQPTVKDDGEKVLMCTQCGAVYQGVLLSGYPEFLSDAVTRIRSAAPGAQVVLRTERWMSIDSTVLDEMTKHPDVAVVIDYIDQGTGWEIIIPAGTDAQALKDENGYAGFRYLAVLFGRQAR